MSFLQQELHDVDLANLLHAADCVVLPYLEIVGSGALAACLTLARGVVVSDLPYFRESLAREPDAGVFFRPGDAPGLAAAVTDVLFHGQLETTRGSEPTRSRPAVGGRRDTDW